MKFDIVSLFPAIFDALNYGIVGRALEQGLIEVKHWNPRNFTYDIHQTVDDRPYGGGPGMVMKAEPLLQAIRAAKNASTVLPKTIYLSPQGKPLTQEAIAQLAQEPQLLLIAGRYEGIDERVIQLEVDEEWSIGDYVLSGGEFPALVLIDAITRLLPGALGHEQSAQQDSFSEGLLDCPHYTRPEDFEGLKVPSVLLSGDHRAIARWRMKESLAKTWQIRPDLLKRCTLTKEQQKLLDEHLQEQDQ
ncbi:MAG TPA: tRNA (guanosine(37)-N1)-methyltransferase TrmD [Coxiellaceae bacterium]|nr:tRNA (guanosine(37)-N1)-methyltransferase TrmD [Coxiellaceae bacterium]